MLPENLKNKKILLASKSPRRKQLLEEAGFKIEVINSLEVKEDIPPSVTNENAAIYLSTVKAEAYQEYLMNGIILIAADTIVCLNEKILGKPKDFQDAFQMLKSLSGKMHTVITGVTLMSLDKKLSFSSLTKVYFKEITDSEISDYINRCKPYDKAGAYGIQDSIGLTGIEKIEGCYYNVMGLPVEKVYDNLKKYYS